jgi:Ras-related protein Rab-2A
VVYDVTSQASKYPRRFILLHHTYLRAGFANARTWLSDVRQYADPNLTCILVGNKVDLCESGDGTDAGAIGSTSRRKRREVLRETAELWAKEEGLLFIEASARSGDNVNEAFHQAARDVVSKIKKGVFDNGNVCKPALLSVCANVKSHSHMA